MYEYMSTLVDEETYTVAHTAGTFSTNYNEEV